MATPPIDPTACRLAVELKHTSPLVGCRFDPSGRFLFAGAQDNSIQRYDLLTGRKTALAGHPSWVRALAFAGGSQAVCPLSNRAFPALAGGVGTATVNPAGFTLIAADYHGQVRWWDGAKDEPTPTRTVEAHAGWARAAAVSPDGKTLATCGNDRLVKLWAVADGKAVTTLEGHGSHVYNVAFHPGGKTLVSADLMGVVKEWDLATGKIVREFDAGVLHKYDSNFAADIGGIRGMAFRPDGAVLACAGITNVSNAFAGVGNPLVLLFDMKDGKAKQLKPKETFQGTGWGVGFLPTGHVVAAGGGGQGRVWFWTPDGAANVHTVTVPANARDLALHPDGTALAVAGANGTAYVYTVLPAPPGKKEPPPAKK